MALLTQLIAVIRETFLWWLKTKRERDRKTAEVKVLFTDGEREILMAMAKRGDQLWIWVSHLLGGGPPLIVGSGNTEVPLRKALQTDVFNLRKKGYLVDSGKSRYSLTEKGQAAGEELIRLFGCHDAGNTSCTH